jgi:primosomal protein N'
VLSAARSGDLRDFLAGERARRLELRLPPFSALALASGDQAQGFVDALVDLKSPVEVAGRPDGSFLLRADDHAALLAAIRATQASGAHCRIAVDPDI